MASIANLSVSLTAHTNDFSTKMMAAQKHIVNFSATLTQSASGLYRWGAGLAAAAIGGGILEMLKKTEEAIISTAHLADRLGYTVQELNALNDAAAQTGLSTSDLDAHLEKLSKTLGEGSKKTEEALGAIGLSSGKLIVMRPAEQFQAIAEGISHLSLQSEKAAVAARLFGRGGYELLNLLQKGKHGLLESAEATKRLRGEFSRVDAGKVEQAHEAMNKLQIVISGVLQKSVARLSPLVTTLVDKFLALNTGGKSAADSIVDGMQRVAKSFAMVFDAINIVISGFHLIEGVVVGFEQAMLKINEAIAHGMIATANLFGASIDNSRFEENQRRIIELERQKQEAFQKTQIAWDAAMNHEISGAVVREVSHIDRLAELRAEDEEYRRKYFAQPMYHLHDNDMIEHRSTTAGTFSGEAANRLTGGASIAEKQLEELKILGVKLDKMNDNIEGGVPLD